MRYTILALLTATICVIGALAVAPGSSRAGVRLIPPTLIESGKLVPEEVRTVVVERAGEEPMRFERNGEAWSQVSPIVHPMDPFSIRQLIGQAAQSQVLDEVELSGDEEALSKEMLGLSPPLARISYESPAGSVSLLLGRIGLGGRAYVQVMGDDRVLVIKSDLHDRAAVMDPREWRDRTLLPGVSVDAQRISYQAAGASLVLERERRRWKLVQPVATRADTTAVEAYVANLAKAQLDGFILDAPDSLDRFGLEPGVGVVEVMMDNSSTTQRVRIGLPIGAASGDRFGVVEGRPTVVRINRATVEAMFPAVELLIAPTGSGVPSADVKTITIRAGGSELEFERDLEKWRSLTHDGLEISATLVEELLRQLTELRAPRVSVEPYPMEQQAAIITLGGFGGKPLDTVRIVKDETTGNWGFENGDNVLRIFPASMKLRLAPSDYGLPDASP